MDERARMLEPKLKEEAVFFAAGVGIVQTMRADGRDPADVAREEGGARRALRDPPRNIRGIPPPAAPRRRDPGDQPQRHFRGHANDVRCDDTRDDATRGERRDGRVPAAMVWSIDSEERATPAGGVCVAASLAAPRPVISVAFDVSGRGSRRCAATTVTR